MAKKRIANPDSGITGSSAAPAREHRRRDRVTVVTPSADPTATATAAWDSAAAKLDAGAVALDRAPEYHEIATLAYSHWEARGCPYGSPEVDWLRAERDLRAERGNSVKA